MNKNKIANYLQNKYEFNYDIKELQSKTGRIK